MNEILDILDLDENDECDVYIERPNCGNVINEDSGNEEVGTPLYPENLSDNQLLVLAELRYRNQSGIEDEVEDIEPTNKKRRTTKGAPAKPKWEKEDKLQGLAPFPAGD